MILRPSLRNIFLWSFFSQKIGLGGQNDQTLAKNAQTLQKLKKIILTEKLGALDHLKSFLSCV